MNPADPYPRGDPHTLSGAYALGALSDGERAAFERHLTGCEGCAQEARELSATAGRLGLATAERPPARLKPEVLRRIAHVRQDGPVVAGHRAAWTGPLPVPARVPAPPRRRVTPRWALAACLAAAAALGGTVAWQQHQRAEEAQRQAQADRSRLVTVAGVLAADDATARTGRLPGGGSGTVVVSRDLDRAVFAASRLPGPPPGRVYQLWYDDGDGMRPAGLLDPDRPTGAVLLEGGVGSAKGMGITVEPAGGSPRPTGAPLMVLGFPVR
ncbi:anti-sigma factor domain-containing protein [Streptomyces sp. NPDC050504]|uniref:anti-sigma factor n=1 Tax=Streptomyces sp. NPDC050504 TaxID=3365618 RepID=UPI00378DD79C